MAITLQPINRKQVLPVGVVDRTGSLPIPKGDLTQARDLTQYTTLPDMPGVPIRVELPNGQGKGLDDFFGMVKTLLKNIKV